MIFLVFLVITVCGCAQTQLVADNNVGDLTTRDPGLMPIALDGSLTFTRNWLVPLASCECRIHWSNDAPQPVMNLRRGQKTMSFSGERYWYKAQYAGRGLDRAECGVHLSDVQVIGSLLTCRACTAGGRCQEHSVIIMDEVLTRHPVTSQARVEVTPGSNVTVLFAAGRPLTNCRIGMPDVRYDLDFAQGHASPSLGRYRYDGSGLKRGQCGISITNVTDRSSGIVMGYMRLQGVSETRAAATLLIVRAAPSVLEFRLSTGSEYSVGDFMNATCSVFGGVPQASISWFLGDKLIRSDEEDDIPDLGWTWPWEPKDITQTLSHRITAEDFGKELICRAGHPLLSHIVEARRTIYAPDELFEPTIFLAQGTTYRVGDNISAVCIVPKSKPANSITWYLGDQEIRSEQERHSSLPDPELPSRGTLMAYLRHTVTAADDRKKLVCRNSRPGSAGYRESNKEIFVILE